MRWPVGQIDGLVTELGLKNSNCSKDADVSAEICAFIQEVDEYAPTHVCCFLLIKYTLKLSIDQKRHENKLSSQERQGQIM